jgi:hypothetical protein
MQPPTGLLIGFYKVEKNHRNCFINSATLLNQICRNLWRARYYYYYYYYYTIIYYELVHKDTTQMKKNCSSQS